jgi:hypothetical protein
MSFHLVACTYALLRFRPFQDRGEFVNVGLALWCDELRVFDYCCDTRAGDRVESFFPDLDPKIFVQAIRQMAEELNRTRALLSKAATPKRLFQELVRQREGIVTFGPEVVSLTADVGQLKKRLVEEHISKNPAPAPEDSECPEDPRVLLALKILAPVTVQRLNAHLLSENVHVPDPKWLQRTLDKLRKKNMVVRSKEGDYSLTGRALWTIPAGKKRTSSDVQRVLALRKKKW